MRIIHIVPGSGGTFYCQNCVRDIALVKAFRELGHDVVVVPMYLPLFTDDPDIVGDAPVFFGGVNVYLQQQFALFRRTPRWLDRLLDSKWMLKRAAAREGSTRAADLGAMTLSMLHGSDGHQRKEVERLIAWMRDIERPDVVQVSNALLLGVARELKLALDVPVVCSLQDEEGWLDATGAPYAQQCWTALAEDARSVDAFVSVSQWYARQMAERMSIPADRITVVPLGIEVDEATPPSPSFAPPVIGFLSRLAAAQGLDVLVDAFLELKRRGGWRDLRLRATGGVTPADKRFVDALRDRLARHGVDGDVDFVPRFDGDERHRFLQSISVLSVPSRCPEAFGMFMLEAWAHGVPVVQPRVGAFPEVVEAGGGGVIYDPNTASALADALEGLLLDPAKASALGAQGRRSVMERFTIERMAKDMAQLYGTLAGTPS